MNDRTVGVSRIHSSSASGSRSWWWSWKSHIVGSDRGGGDLVGERAAACGPHGAAEGGDVVGAVVALAVDEEAGRAGDAAAVGVVDVLGDPRGVRVPAQVVGEPVDVEAEAARVLDELVRAELVLARQQAVVHRPERALRGGRLRRLAGELR